ncbi:MAG: 7TM diverse intracellular signaling domain-containing protein, partial [Campylobacterota bacterium]|nr:7TM diverse intracellular signaling domain-containing protein [Campylobacterota bacterium]
MTNLAKKNLLLILLIFLISTFINAESIDISQSDEISLLENSYTYFSKEPITLQKIIKKNLFIPYKKSQINIGASRKTIWIKLHLQNSTSKDIEKSLIFTSALLEYIALYQKETNGTYTTPIIKGVSHIDKTHSTLFPYFAVKLNAHSSEEYYIEVKSLYEPIDFRVLVKNRVDYLHEDQIQQFINIILIGMVVAFMLYSLLLSFYTKDKSYRYYSLYLFMLIYQQLTYLGLTQIYFPHYLAMIDIQIPVIKINILLITAALFAISFLKIPKQSILYKIYKYFILIAFFEIIILSLPNMYNLDIVIITGLLFIIFNLIA